MIIVHINVNCIGQVAPQLHVSCNLNCQTLGIDLWKSEGVCVRACLRACELTLSILPVWSRSHFCTLQYLNCHLHNVFDCFNSFFYYLCVLILTPRNLKLHIMSGLSWIKNAYDCYYEQMIANQCNLWDIFVRDRESWIKRGRQGGRQAGRQAGRQGGRKCISTIVVQVKLMSNKMLFVSTILVQTDVY